MTEARMLLWVPAPIDQVRPALHKAGIGSGVVVAVESGTVVVPRDRMGISMVANWVYRFVRRSGTAAVVLVWNDQASLVLPIGGAVALGWEWGSAEACRRLIADLGGLGPVARAGMALAGALTTSKRGPAKQTRAAARIATALDADETVVLARVQQYEQRLPVELFLDEIGKPDVAGVARLVDAGQFDHWRTERSVRAEWHRAIGLTLLIAVVVTTLVTTVLALTAPHLLPVMNIVLPALLLVVLLSWWYRIRYRTRPLPVDEVLPIVQVPEASDNQSAR